MENTEQNIELLNDIYQDTKMGEESIKNILPSVEDKELLEHFQAQMSGYSEYYNKARELLAKQQEIPKENGMMEKMMVGMSTKVNTLIDKTPSHLAEMVIQGCNMGVIQMTKHLNQYDDQAENEVVKLARDVMKFEEESAKKLQKYLQ